MITTAEGRNLPLLPKITVHTMYFDRDAEHPARGLAVEVFTFTEGLQGAGFAGEPCQDSGFDCTEVGDDEAVDLTGNERGANELAQGVR